MDLERKGHRSLSLPRGGLLKRAGVLTALTALIAAGALAVVVSNAGTVPSVTQASTTQTQNVNMLDFGYEPASFEATAGESLTVTVNNTGDLPHTFTITGVIDTGSVAPGATESVTFTPSEAGTLTFFCVVHGESAMSGQLTVTEADPPAAPGEPTATPAPAAATPTPAPASPQPPATGDGGLLNN